MGHKLCGAFQKQPKGLRWESTEGVSWCELLSRSKTVCYSWEDWLLVRLWENYTVGLDKWTAILLRWTEMASVTLQPSTTLHPVPAYLAQQSKGGGGLKRGLELNWWVCKKRRKRRGKARDWVGELVQYFDNGFPWMKPNRSSGHEGGNMQGGKEWRDEDKVCKAKECAFRHILRPQSSNLTEKMDFKDIYFPFSPTVL